METLQRFPSQFRKEVFKKLEEIVDIASLSHEERIKYDESIKVYRDNLAVMAYARNEGEEKGLAKGRAEGLAEGRMEQQLEIARKMKEINMPIETICQVTGLSAEKVKSL